MKEIILSKGKYTTVDDEDFDFLNQWKWFYASVGYPGRWFKRKFVTMHNFLLNTPVGKHTDHINGDILDNRKSNLRICEVKENIRNQKLHINNTSGYKGVTWCKRDKRWKAQLMLNRKNLYLGNFKDKEKAAKAYKEAAIKHFGAFARL